MDGVVDSINKAYEEFVAAAANALQAKQDAGALKTTETDAALQNFKHKWEQFKVVCDQAQESVESMKRRIGSECLVDEATGHVAGKPGQATMTAVPPVSAVRLQQMSKAVRKFVTESTAANSAPSHASPPFDARFSKDAAQ